MQNTKWLFIAFCVLLIIVVGEVVYYFFVLTPQRNTTQNFPIQNQSLPGSPNSIPQNTPTPFLPAQSDSAVKYINNIDKKIITSSKFINVYQGKITIFEKRNGTFTDQNYDVSVPYTSILRITSTSNPEAYTTFYFSDNDINKMTVVQKENNTESTINYNDLKVNDIISIEETMDTFQTNYADVFTYKIIRE